MFSSSKLIILAKMVNRNWTYPPTKTSNNNKNNSDKINETVSRHWISGDER